LIPSQSECEIPVLKVLLNLGGEGTPKSIYPHVRAVLQSMTDAEAAEVVPSGEPRWINRIRWARLNLIKKGELESPGHGVWRITEAGKRRVTGAGASPAPVSVPTGLVEIYETYEADFRKQLLERLLEFSPAEFEAFAPKLLKAYGFVDLVVRAKSGDGGIDGSGRLKVGLATMNVAFQCKRWVHTVGRPEIDKFRGAIQGEYEQGLFFTTSDFTKQATDASIKKGAVPVVLINGEIIVDIMIKQGLGVQRRPFELFYERLGTIFEEG
jgi:restriction system protein